MKVLNFSAPTEQETLFVDHLASLDRKRDLAALAQLRRGLGKTPSESMGMYPYIMPYIPRESFAWIWR